MGAADRTIQHLHLRAPSAQAAVRAVHRLEDALRCASLPDAGERVLLVRRLHLGRLPEGLSSQSLSLLIEKRVAAVGGEWVHGGDQARAAHRDSVFFTSRLQAAQAALRRRANGQSLDGWYWPLALPGVALQAEPANFLAQLVVSLCPQPGAPALLVALAIDAVEQGGTAPGVADPALHGAIAGPDTVDGIAPAQDWENWWQDAVRDKREGAPWHQKATAEETAGAQ